MSFRNSIARLALAAFTMANLAAPALAQDAEQPIFSLELNTAADTTDGGCRLTYVASNQTEQTLESVSYQVAIFDAQGIVTDLLVLEFGGFTNGRTKVSQFDFGGRSCADISRITVNEVASCTVTDTGEADFCFSALQTASRSTIQFGI